MNIEEVRRTLILIDKVGSLEYNNFGDACLDPQATILAVNDFESFKRVFAANSTRKTREDRLQRLYGGKERASVLLVWRNERDRNALP